MRSILLGGGCFWCTESVFGALKGVQGVVSGYAGGSADTANYQAVCTGTTGHVEVVQVVYDDQVIDLSQILAVFFATHDPTTPNRQGNDIGTQYASVIFYDNQADQVIAEQLINELIKDGIPVVTRLEMAPQFYPAESYHQNYFANNPTQPYCNFAIPPKLAKLREKFTDLLK
ncbi:peptide-methionine (S)-S-oxide reductase MsrA [Moraxella sp. FZLJ2107]|uniref:peptide-methionine (S)-S-oxide reductase MsrA n=1 Tax=unclassified Moraxella TaxID=2685852 RepID=UPI0020C902A4|nr:MULTISPECIES: peptide-methionine (S)-S-oxide reductase MsrA [unclassified Moraxella]UTO06169.1 peptide-methionine (S)-S-oxide reductase MsrA [Moraxella sp. FZLJ2107]UTO23446.1 peptide-methionine (S)-S-oxide reductase MsrA [Moraxella sp. FZLJ2109]